MPGLTAKHIDTEELIKVLGESQDAPVIQRPTPENAPVGTYAMWDERMSVTPHPRLKRASRRNTPRGY